MIGFEWRRSPVRHDPKDRGAPDDRHTVLVVVRSAACGQHLLDVVRLVESDPRVKVAFTTESDTLDRGVERLLTDVEAVLVPRRLATTREFGLAITTDLAAVRRVRAPSVVMPFGERIETAVLREAHRRDLRCATGTQRVVHGCGAGPASIVLAHEAEAARLTRCHPETLPVTKGAGDTTYDRLTVSLPLRTFYRRALGVGPRQRLAIVVARHAACPHFGRADLLARLPVELPPEEYRVIALFPPEPGMGGMGLGDCLRNGLGVLPPEGDWRAALVAADWIIDDGAVGPYGTVTGVPVLLSGVHEVD